MSTSTWVLDPAHSEVNFKIRHLMIANINGSFEKFDVEAAVENDDFTQSKISFTADAASVTTNNEQRDQHLKSADFFDPAHYPTIRFDAVSSEDVDKDGSYVLNGNLTIKDVTKPQKLDVEFGGIQKDPWGNLKAGFTINGKINREDFGLKWNTALDTGGVLVSEEVRINCEIQLRKHVDTKID
jgi:polyisoprenoid-binding protein YceI